MQKNCLNCGHIVSEKYCPNCSQSTQTGRLQWGILIEDFVHTLTHADKSLLGTTKQMIFTPGRVLSEYIAGKRKKYQSPVSYFLIWVTLSILTHRLVLYKIGFHPVYLKGLTFASEESTLVLIKHGQWLYTLSFPLMAFLLYLFIAKPLFSFIETLVIISYTFSTCYMFFALFYLIWAGLFSFNVLHWKFYLFQIVFTDVFVLWVLISLFRNNGIAYLWLRLLVFTLINTVLVLQLLEFLCNQWLRFEWYFSH